MNKQTLSPAQPRSARPGGPSAPHMKLEGIAAEAARAGESPAHALGATLAARNLVKNYRKGSHIIPVLRGVNVEFRAGEMVSIVGSSGSGKSTLLHLLGTLDAPDKGEVHLDGARIDNLSNSRRDQLRNQTIGMIFQFYHLLPELTALENVLSPTMIAQSTWSYLRNRKKNHERARELLELVGLGHRLRHKPRELSGGEMQRTAIARALMARPRVLLADEPTGNLDRRAGSEILAILRQLNEREKLTVVMVTHDQAIASAADRSVSLVEGRVEAA